MTTLEQLAERADAAMAELRRVPPLDLVRAALNEAGLARARGVLRDEPDRYGNALEALRAAERTERSCREAHDAAVVEAEWALGDCFVTEGKDTYLVTPCLHEERDDYAANCPVCGTGEVRRKMLAAEKAAWIAGQAAKQSSVQRCAEALRRASEDVAGCRDSVEVAKARLRACAADLDAAVAHVNALVVAIPR